MNVLLISGSPTENGSTEILLRRIGDSISEHAPETATVEFVRLNELTFIPCQACAKSPEPEVCFYQDALWPVYQSLIDADIIALGSPVFFDSVSAQTKMFIDRCSCFRPPDYANETAHNFKKIVFKKTGLKRRIGAGVLVAGERGRFDLARSVMRGFFKWTEIDASDFVTYETPDFRKAGEVANSPSVLANTDRVGKALLDKYLSAKAPGEHL